MKYFKVLCFFFFTVAICRSETYLAAVSKTNVGTNRYSALIQEAGQINVDLLLLPSPDVVSTEITTEYCENELISHDEVLKEVSAAAKKAHIYVVASLYEKVLCHNKEEVIRSTIVFDRNGALLPVYRKPVDSGSKCNTTTSKMGRFSTDFGVTFGVIMEEELILTNLQDIGIKNFIVVGSSIQEMSFLSAKQFPSSWAFANKANVISTKGVLSGDTIKTNNLNVTELEKSGNDRSVLITSPPSSFPGEDLSLYIIKPLNIAASAGGYRDGVCHGSFCCEFYVKTSVVGTDLQDVSYGLVSFEGIHRMGSQNIGVQTCALVACAGLYKRTCFLGSQNHTTNIKFDKIIVSANFTNANSAQFPTLVTTSRASFDTDNFEFLTDKKDSKHVTARLRDADDVLTFGIFGRDYSKDYVCSENGDISESVNNFTEYISSENVQEFFDYLWIRLRVLIFIVSIYVLEMM